MSSANRPGAGQDGSLVQTIWTWLRGGRRRRNGEHLRDAIEELIEEEEGADAEIESDERTLIKNILDLHDQTVEDVMVPRADIVSIEETASLDEIVTLVRESSHSRIPVYRGNLDDVLGIVHIRDVIDCLHGRKSFDLASILREVLFVVPSMRILDLLIEMRTTRKHMALVVDEFGGIDGLVTIEDLVEEIVGEIEDEHDKVAGPDLQESQDGALVADARVPIEELEKRYGPVLSEEEREDIDTLGGLVFALAGRVPARGELLTHPSGLEFEVLEADQRRIKRLRVAKRQQHAPQS
ncbi:MAG: hemolysin family protein [Alphaproteobacteria bacterium]|nr:hemolysin family protein [Alphaproteobacteria bacterium]